MTKYIKPKTVDTKLFKTKTEITILFLLKNPKDFPEKEKSIVLVFS
jgi:hypothetical protein